MNNETLSAEELGNKLLQSVKEMKAGKAARISLVEPNEVAQARSKTGLTPDRVCCGVAYFRAYVAGMGTR